MFKCEYQELINHVEGPGAWHEYCFKVSVIEESVKNILKMLVLPKNKWLKN